MLIDYRYHIMTLVAVFLALGLGVLIGGALFSDESLLESQAELVKRLEQDFRSLRAENQRLSQSLNLLRLDLNRQRQFSQWLLPKAVAGRLEGQSFALVSAIPPDRQYFSQFTNLIQQAGGRLVAELSIDPQKWREAGRAEYQQLAGILAVGIRGPTLTSLEQAGYIQFSGKEPFPAREVLLLEDEDDPGSQLVKESLVEMGLRVHSLPVGERTIEEQAKFLFTLIDEVQNERHNSDRSGT
ncbi:MAG: copper transporter [Firmicutes bacterium]|nr:copper transporter [Bacillota bacterium]